MQLKLTQSYALLILMATWAGFTPNAFAGFGSLQLVVKPRNVHSPQKKTTKDASYDERLMSALKDLRAKEAQEKRPLEAESWWRELFAHRRAEDLSPGLLRTLISLQWAELSHAARWARTQAEKKLGTQARETDFEAYLKQVTLALSDYNSIKAPFVCQGSVNPPSFQDLENFLQALQKLYNPAFHQTALHHDPGAPPNSPMAIGQDPSPSCQGHFGQQKWILSQTQQIIQAALDGRLGWKRDWENLRSHILKHPVAKFSIGPSATPEEIENGLAASGMHQYVPRAVELISKFGRNEADHGWVLFLESEQKGKPDTSRRELGNFTFCLPLGPKPNTDGWEVVMVDLFCDDHQLHSGITTYMPKSTTKKYCKPGSPKISEPIFIGNPSNEYFYQVFRRR